MKGYTLHTQKGGILSGFKPKPFKLITIFRHSYHWPLGALDKNKKQQTNYVGSNTWGPLIHFS